MKDFNFFFQLVWNAQKCQLISTFLCSAPIPTGSINIRVILLSKLVNGRCWVQTLSCPSSKSFEVSCGFLTNMCNFVSRIVYRIYRSHINNLNNSPDARFYHDSNILCLFSSMYYGYIYYIQKYVNNMIPT